MRAFLAVGGRGRMSVAMKRAIGCVGVGRDDDDPIIVGERDNGFSERIDPIEACSSAGGRCLGDVVVNGSAIEASSIPGSQTWRGDVNKK